MQPSQDGKQILVEGSTVVDAAGNVLGTLRLGDPDVRSRIWADDGRHLCLIAGPVNAGPDMGRGSLWLALPGRLGRKVAAVGRLGSSPGVIACSIAGDRAVVTSDQSWYPPDGNKNVITVLVQVVEVSTGRLLYQRDYSQTVPFRPLLVTASPDGRYLAEDGLDGLAAIRDTTTGEVIKSLTATSVRAFSTDGSQAVVRKQLRTGAEAQLVTWRDEKVLWTMKGEIHWAMGRPGGPDLLIGINGPAGGLPDFYAVSADGKARLILPNRLIDIPCPCPGGSV
jgi:hypothetical protein